MELRMKQPVQVINNKDDRSILDRFKKKEFINSKKDKEEESISGKAASQYTRTGTYSTIRYNQKNYSILNKINNHQKTKTGRSYTEKAKSYVKNKLNRNTIKVVETQTKTITTTTKATKRIKVILENIKKSAQTINILLSSSSALVLLLVMTMFMGTFSVFAKDGGSNSEIFTLSDEVLTYEETINEYASIYGLDDYIGLIEAIMMNESKGSSNDPMNASNTEYNTQYPNGIEDPIYSIDCGIHFLSDCISLANVSGSSDTEHIYLAIQGYNFGKDYITWALDNFEGYSVYNAQIYFELKCNEGGLSSFGDINYVNHVMQYVGFTFRGGTDPNFNNQEAWITKNPYAPKLYGQCTWFAWGRFYELYGYDPGFIGDGTVCVDQLVAAHPDKFEKSTTPKAGAVFSGLGKNHVGIVIKVEGSLITVQEGNLDGKTNTFLEAQTDWHTARYSLSQLENIYKGVIFANPK